MRADLAPLRLVPPPRLLISAAHKSSGKTTFSTGLAAALTRRGLVVQTYKKGPDYIDPLWLKRASGRPCYNLDFNTQGPEEIEATIAAHAAGVDFELIEGNKGLHDGVDLEGRDSSAALAKLVGAPVVLVLDASGMTRGIAPLVMGYQVFDRDVDIRGIVLNRVATARQEEKLRQALERYTDLKVLGCIGRSADLTVVERHLGLTTPQETVDVDGVIAHLGETIAAGVDLGALVDLASTPAHGHRATVAPVVVSAPAAPAARPVTIGVVRDAAFCFHYQDDLEALERAGARLTYFSALTAPRLPEIDGLFIGGGFPESHIGALAVNVGLRRDIARASAEGLPIYAECGGLMYLSRSIAWKGEVGEMVGVVPGDAVVHDRPQGRGLVVIEETAAMPWPRPSEAGEAPLRVRAHEFHYARIENLAPGCRFAYRVLRGDGITGRDDGIVIANTMASFTHLRDTARGRWAERFVAFVRARRDEPVFAGSLAGLAGGRAHLGEPAALFREAAR